MTFHWDGGSGGQQQDGPDRQREHEQANEDTLLSSSAVGHSGQGGPFRNYTPEQVARLYQRSSNRKPMGATLMNENRNR